MNIEQELWAQMPETVRAAVTKMQARAREQGKELGRKEGFEQGLRHHLDRERCRLYKRYLGRSAAVFAASQRTPRVTGGEEVGLGQFEEE